MEEGKRIPSMSETMRSSRRTTVRAALSETMLRYFPRFLAKSRNVRIWTRLHSLAVVAHRSARLDATMPTTKDGSFSRSPSEDSNGSRGMKEGSGESGRETSGNCSRAITRREGKKVGILGANLARWWMWK